MKPSRHREGTSWRNVLGSGHRALREGANLGTIQEGVRKIGKNARCVLSLKELGGGGYRRNKGRQGQGWKETTIRFLSALNAREGGYLAVNEIVTRPNSGSQILLSLLGQWSSPRLPPCCPLARHRQASEEVGSCDGLLSPRRAISPSTHNLPGTGGTLMEKAAAPKPRYWVAAGMAAQVCPPAWALLRVRGSSGPPLLLWRDHLKSWLRWENSVTRPGRRAHAGPLTGVSQADSACQHCSPARPLGAGAGALPPAVGGRGGGGGRTERCCHAVAGAGRHLALAGSGTGSPGQVGAHPPSERGHRQGSGDGRGPGPAAASRGSPLVVCPSPSHQAAAFLFSAVLRCRAARSSPACRELHALAVCRGKGRNREMDLAR